MIITWHYPLTIGCPKFVTNPPVQQVQHAGPTPALQKLGTSSKPVFTNCSSASSRWPDNHRIYNRSWPPQVGNTWDMRTLQLSWNITTFSWNSIPKSSFTNIFAVLLWTCWGWKKNNSTGFWTSFSQRCRCKSTMFWQTQLWPLWSDPLRKSKVLHSVGYIFNLWNIYIYIWYPTVGIWMGILMGIYLLIWKISRTHVVPKKNSTPPSRTDPRDNRRESSPGKIPDRVFESSAAEFICLDVQSII